ncbi:MAG: SAF domain-containing protein [Bacillota bacterium]|nr:SAF domain-containing protein [Bacillota bacterium]
MKKKYRPVIGAVLIVLSVSLMIFWEAAGRNMLFDIELTAAGRDISAGEVCQAEDLIILSIPRSAAVSGGIVPEDISRYIGKKFKYDISKNSQLTVNSFISEEKEIPDGMSLFHLKKDWIKNISNSIRKGDTVSIYSYDELTEPVYIGKYYVAFVKDGSGREVTETTGFEEPRILYRTNGISVPTDVEIAAELKDYTSIVKAVASGCTLILVQEGVSVYER